MSTKYNIFFPACLMLLLGSACNKKLNIAPEGVLTEKTTLQQESTAESLLAGAYQQMFGGMNGDAYTVGDLTSGLAQGSVNNYYTGAIDPNDETVDQIWDNTYAAINLANVIITELKLYAQFDTATQDRFVAEAKFIRAFSYFNLLKLFGEGAIEGQQDSMGVPLRLEAFNGYDGSQNIPRSTNQQVYTQIMQDLNDAIAVLPVNYTDPVNEYCRATRSAAAALAARVELYLHNYSECNTYCDMVMSDGYHTLQPSPVAVFPDNSSGNRPYAFNPEIIFAFPVSYDNNPTQYALHNIYYTYGYAYPDSAFLSSYAANDLRRTAMIIPGQYVSQLPVKFSDPNLRDNLVMIRLAEVVLTKAEALAYLNGLNQTSVDLLNEIHQRAFPSGAKPSPYTITDFAGQQALITAILQERRWELAFEGHDRFDKIRSGLQPNPVLPPGRYAFPIPQSEIDITSGLIKQNPGYTN